MTRWVAKFNENDDMYGDEIRIGIVGGECGYEAILSNGDDADVFPGMTIEEAKENLEDSYGYYETFVWLDED